jgi:ABC-type branched-subunit amino acid transport system substrate-binding protein
MQPSLFFSGNSLEAYGLAGGEFMTQVAGKRGFLLYTDYAWGWVIKDGFVKNGKANGGEIIGALPVPPGTTDFGPFLMQVIAKKPDYVAFISNGMMFINGMKQAYALGMKDQMKFATFHVSSDEVIGCGPEVIRDVYLVTDYFWNIQTERNRMFVEDFIKKYGSDKRPSLRHFLQHTAVNMWADTVNKAGTADPKTIAAGLVGFKGDFGKGEIEVRKTGDHTTVQPIVIARGKGPKEMKDKFDTQEIVKLVKGEQYFGSAKEKGW